MDTNLIWSIVLAAVGILGIYLAGSKSLWGWVVSFSAQVLWIIFAVVTKQYGFILSALAYGWVYGRNYMKWRRETTTYRALKKGVKRGQKHAIDLDYIEGEAWGEWDCDGEFDREGRLVRGADHLDLSAWPGSMIVSPLKPWRKGIEDLNLTKVNQTPNPSDCDDS